MNALLRTWHLLSVAARRLVAQRGLALATLLGLVAAVALTISIPLYADAVYYRVLSEGLFSDAPRLRGKALRPPAVLLFSYVGSFTGPLQWEQLGPLDAYFGHDLYVDLELPPSGVAPAVRMFNTGLFGFFRAGDAEVITTQPPLLDMSLATIDEPERHLRIVEGGLANASPGSAALEVLLSRTYADQMGISPGEVYLAYDLRAQRKFKPDPALFELRISGVWEPANARDEFWEYTQLPPQNLIFVSEEAFVRQVAPALDDEIYQALWYLPLDVADVHVSDVGPLLERIEDLTRRVARFLPNTTLDVSPIKPLTAYREAANRLTVLLLAFSVPIVVLVLAFVVLVATLMSERQRSQVATLRSRGATAPQVAGITALEGGLLVGTALLLALPASLLLAYSIGQTRSFLDFSLATDLRVGLTWSSARWGLLVVVLALGALVLPVLGSARHTIVTYKRERARSLRRPWWQRIWLDVLLLIPAGYGTYILSQQGSILRRADEVPADAFQDPLLFLVPALAVCALALFLLRLLPLVLRALAWGASYLKSVGLLLAARQLARAAGFYATPLGLLIVTLSLSVYTASLAATLDSHLHDQQYYLVGADASLVDLGDDPSAWSSGGGDSEGAQSWNFAPISSYLYIPGVEAATRVGRYDALVQTGSSYQPATYLGVDRVVLGEVAFWRRDFAREPLGALMNRLAATQDGVLLPEAFARQQLLQIGDRVNVVIKAFGQNATVPLTYMGPLELFPTWYPGPDDDGVLVLGNLDYLFDTAMTQMPYRVWLRTSRPVDEVWLKEQVFEISLGAQAVMAAGPRVQREQSRPERQGLLGLLSVGFGAAAFLAALGFVLYALFTFRRRSVELGVMRAMGVSTGQLTLYVVCELGFLLLVGGAAGTGLGVLSSHTFIPFLQIGAEATARFPPFVVEIDWPSLLRVYALFGVIYLLALIVLVRSLVRMRLFDAIKMGEAV